MQLQRIHRAKLLRASGGGGATKFIPLVDRVVELGKTASLTDKNLDTVVIEALIDVLYDVLYDVLMALPHVPSRIRMSDKVLTKLAKEVGSSSSPTVSALRSR